MRRVRNRYPFAGGLNLNGSSQLGTVQNLSGASVPAEFTVLMWLKVNSLPAAGSTSTLFGNYYRTSPLDYFDVRLGQNVGGLYLLNGFAVNNSSASAIPSTAAIPGAGRPLLATLSRTSAGVVAVSLNGISSATTSPSTPAFSTFGNFRVGSSGGGAFLNGIIGEVDFLPVALPIDLIRRIYNSGRGDSWRDRVLGGVTSTFRHKLDDTSGPAADASGNARPLLLTGSPTFGTF